jgi:hypothetical protein
MGEIVCSHCGRMFASAADLSVCPDCGQNPQGPALKKMFLMVSENYGIAIWIVWLFLSFRPQRNDWGQDAVLLALLAAAGLSMLYFRRSQSGSRGFIPALNLNQPRAPSESREAVWSPPPAPRVPGEWSALMSVPRPREVFWPFWSLMRSAVDVIFLMGSMAYVFHAIRSHGSFADSERMWPHTLLVFAITAICDGLVATHLYRETGNQQLLRDGDVAMGSLVDVLGRKGVAIAVYQFWTRNGQMFQHRGRFVRGGGDFSAPGVVPVFYFPQNPSRSLALCSTNLRVRVPRDDFAPRAERLGAKR